MTTMNKDLTSEHIVAFGRKFDENGNTIGIKFQIHPEIEKWINEHNPEIICTLDNPTIPYTINISVDDSYIPFTEREIKTSKRDIENILKTHHITLKLSKHQYKFMFPVFRKTPKLPLNKIEMEKLVRDGIWDAKIFNKNCNV